jgi:hypothetical protein
MNTENISIKTFIQRGSNIKGNDTVLCSPTAAGLWQEMSLPWNRSARQKKENYMIFFVLNNELTWKKTVQMFNLRSKYYP